jgi:hypothetical protein
MTINARKYKRAISCRYCSATGHGVASCPRIELDAAIAQVKLDEGRCLNYVESYALQRHARNEEIRAKRRARGPSKKPRKCGYCEKEGHTRRHCAVLSNDKETLIKANEVWRRLWAQQSKVLGFAPATLINVNNSADNAWHMRGRKEGLTMVGNQLPENLTVFAMADDFEMRQTIAIPLINGDKLTIQDFVEDNTLRQMLYSGYYYGNTTVEVLSQSTYKYPDGWFVEQPDDINFALKRWNSKKLSTFIVKCIAFIQTAQLYLEEPCE